MILQEHPFYKDYSYIDKEIEEKYWDEWVWLSYILSNIMNPFAKKIADEFNFDENILNTYFVIGSKSKEEIIKIVEFYRKKGAWEINPTILQRLDEFWKLDDARCNYWIYCDNKGYVTTASFPWIKSHTNSKKLYIEDIS